MVGTLGADHGTGVATFVRGGAVAAGRMNAEWLDSRRVIAIKPHDLSTSTACAPC